MKNSANTFMVILIFICIPFFTLAQKAPINFGSVSMDEMTMKDYDQEPGSSAIILCDFSIIDIVYINEEFQVKYNHIRRIKIFTTEGYEWATYSIPLFKKDNLNEVVAGLKGFTYNLENGKIIKSKLNKSAIFIEKVKDNEDKMKFTMPDVKEGSVLEFSYIKTSDFLSSIDPWAFQHSIPVVYSELYFKVPQYFNYLHISSGYESFSVYDQSIENRTFTQISTERINTSRVTQSSTVRSSNINYKVNIDHFLAKNMPSLKGEKYVANIDDYRQKIEFQLASTTFNNSYEDILGTWESINKRLNEDVELFGPNMSKKSFYKDALDIIINSTSDPKERAIAITGLVNKKIKWNNTYDYIPNKNIKRIYDEGIGTSSDINALLISMLRGANLDAEPVLISTRSNGQINPAYPLLNKFNHLIASVWIDGKPLLLDASEVDVPPGILPENCLNRKGRCISENHNGWVDIEPNEIYNMIIFGYLKLSDEIITGDITLKKTGYAAIDAKSQIRKDGMDKYLENFKKRNTGWDILQDSIYIEESSRLNVKENYLIKTSDGIMNTGDHIYIDPIIIEKFDDNPLKNENRKFPVDFGAPLKNQYIINLTLPNGYMIEEIPQSEQYSLPDKTASFKYLIQKRDSIIQVSTSLEIKKGFYLTTDYKNLREFFSMIVQKSNEQIVLKKLNP